MLTVNLETVEHIYSNGVNLQLTGALPRHFIQDEGAAKKPFFFFTSPKCNRPSGDALFYS